MWLLWQLADSAFPTGSFAHSAGLEAAAQAGEVRGAGDLDAWLDDLVWQTGMASLPFVRAGHADPSGVAAVDARCDAFLVARVANRASRTQGRALCAAAARIFDDPALRPLDERARARSAPAHLAPMSGAVLRILGISERETLAWFLFGTVRTGLAAAVRLGIVGPHEAQRLLHTRSPLLDRVLDECTARGLDDVAHPSPRFDLVASTHDRLYSRLFQS